MHTHTHSQFSNALNMPNKWTFYRCRNVDANCKDCIAKRENWTHVPQLSEFSCVENSLTAQRDGTVTCIHKWCSLFSKPKATLISKSNVVMSLIRFATTSSRSSYVRSQGSIMFPFNRIGRECKIFFSFFLFPIRIRWLMEH